MLSLLIAYGVKLSFEPAPCYTDDLQVNVSQRIHQLIRVCFALHCVQLVLAALAGPTFEIWLPQSHADLGGFRLIFRRDVKVMITIYRITEHLLWATIVGFAITQWITIKKDKFHDCLYDEDVGDEYLISDAAWMPVLLILQLIAATVFTLWRVVLMPYDGIYRHIRDQYSHTQGVEKRENKPNFLSLMEDNLQGAPMDNQLGGRYTPGPVTDNFNAISERLKRS